MNTMALVRELQRMCPSRVMIARSYTSIHPNSLKTCIIISGIYFCHDLSS
jgi:hypothetical protein